MIHWAKISATAVSAILSIADMVNLRTRVYTLHDQREILLTALDDIARMDPDSKVGKLARRTLDDMEHKHGVILGQLDRKIKK